MFDSTAPCESTILGHRIDQPREIFSRQLEIQNCDTVRESSVCVGICTQFGRVFDSTAPSESTILGHHIDVFRGIFSPPLGSQKCDTVEESNVCVSACVHEDE